MRGCLCDWWEGACVRGGEGDVQEVERVGG